MSSPDPDDGAWLYDSVPHYRLNENIIDGYLTKKWGGFKFYIQVNSSSSAIRLEATWY